VKIDAKARLEPYAIATFVDTIIIQCFMLEVQAEKVCKKAEAGLMEEDPPALGDFCNFYKKVTYFQAYFDIKK